MRGTFKVAFELTLLCDSACYVHFYQRHCTVHTYSHSAHQDRQTCSKKCRICFLGQFSNLGDQAKSGLLLDLHRLVQYSEVTGVKRRVSSSPLGKAAKESFWRIVLASEASQLRQSIYGRVNCGQQVLTPVAVCRSRSSIMLALGPRDPHITCYRLDIGPQLVPTIQLPKPLSGYGPFCLLYAIKQLVHSLKTFYQL